MYLKKMKQLFLVASLSTTLNAFADPYVALTVKTYEKLGLWAATVDAIASQEESVRATLLQKADTLCRSVNQIATPTQGPIIGTQFNNSGFYITKGEQSFECTMIQD